MTVLPELLYACKRSRYTHTYSPSKLEVSVKLNMPKNKSTLPSHGGLAVSLHMLKRFSDSWRGHCKWGKKRVLSPLPNGSY